MLLLCKTSLSGFLMGQNKTCISHSRGLFSSLLLGFGFASIFTGLLEKTLIDLLHRSFSISSLTVEKIALTEEPGALAGAVVKTDACLLLSALHFIRSTANNRQCPTLSTLKLVPVTCSRRVVECSLSVRQRGITVLGKKYVYKEYKHCPVQRIQTFPQSL